ncbi:class I SAM-dependent methyltransferase [uncultured Lacinutrix sp.]|uniref:class I SAM-dependent methyltransferase n=1 Tax=uncultured Lacinutrix sp. TaxID=574032 RepID=UPI002606F71D|nr:class I SAM-dependent methyltransferase [uncultured Lacinutrix sp.]
MNNLILNTKNQEFINKNINSEITRLILKGTPDSLVDTAEIIEQIEAKKRCKKKLPTWFSAKNIYYPNKLNIEQTSSEVTAKHKATLVTGSSLIDLTGGFGVDCFYFSKSIKEVTHCEINENLSNIVAHNYKQLNVKNINCISVNGIDVLKNTNKTFDWIYIDPSRRDNIKGKVFLLSDCLPNVPKFLDAYFKYSKNVIVKTSPLLDIASGIKELKHVKAIHVVAVNNEVKELLWILEHDFINNIEIKTVNILKQSKVHFNFYLNEESLATNEFSKPLNYLYEPNAAILKAGAFEYIGEKLNLKKLHKHSHLYTSLDIIDFPGRAFEIEKVIKYNKKQFKQDVKINKANITVRNFPETVSQIRKRLSIKDGGDYYLFFTTDMDNNKIIIVTKKTKTQ